MGMMLQECGWGNYERIVMEQQVILIFDVVFVIIEDICVEMVMQLFYKVKYGFWLEGMCKFLQDNKGVVVVCEDVFGVVQELSFYYLLVLVFYVKWFKMEDG